MKTLPSFRGPVAALWLAVASSIPAQDPIPDAPPPKDSAPTAPANAAGNTSTNEPAPPPAAAPIADGEKGLRMNFRGVSLDMVLEYLSDAAGFIINLETEVRGRVDVWSNQPLTKDEAVGLLNTVLNKNGYAALRNGRTLTIVSRDDAKKRDIPVISGNDPDQIPKSDDLVTQIIPVRYIGAVQLVKDLQPLLPTSATLTANEGGNALVLTDTQSNIRRMAEIVEALDTAVSSVSSVRVFTLHYADAKAVATTIKDLFQQQETTRGNNNNQGGAGRFFAQFRGGPGGGGPGGGTGADTSGGSSRAPTPKVNAVADDRSNSVVVSAPEEQMTVIVDVIQQLDTNVEDITELRVFRLQHADPQETADLLSSLFDDTKSQQTSNNRGGQLRFGGGPFGGIGGNRGGTATTDQSARMQKQTRVVAVPDLRTSSVVVSASRDLMEQIGRMIQQLDADPARKQKVFVYSVENSDPQAVQEVLEQLFPSQNTTSGRNTRNTQRQNNNQLNNRQTQSQNQGNRSGTTSGFGGSSLGGNTQGNR
jgi:type II secretory pathway component GspD/PulD (secretin)